MRAATSTAFALLSFHFLLTFTTKSTPQYSHTFKEIECIFKSTSSRAELCVIADATTFHMLASDPNYFTPACVFFNMTLYMEQLSLSVKSSSLSEEVLAVVVLNSESQFLPLLKKIASLSPTGYRKHFPTFIFYWPRVLIITSSNCSDQSRRITVETELENAFSTDDASFLHKISISDQVLLAFNIECGGKNTDHYKVVSVWEIYSLQFQLSSQSCQWNFCSHIKLNEVLCINNSNEPGHNEILPILRRRNNFHQTKVRAVAPLVKEIKLEVDWDVDKSTGKVAILGGMSVDIFWDFQDLLNFSGEIVPGDWLLTGSQPNVNISTLNLKPVTADLMKNRTVQIMIGHLTPIPSRLQSSDILIPSSYNRLWAYVHQPFASSVRDIFTIAFEPPLWIAFVLSWILILISVRMCIKLFQENVGHSQSFIAPTSLSRLELDTDIDDDDDDAFASDPLFWSLAAITQQGWEIHPKRLSLRLLYFLGILFTLICFLAYSAQIVSILATEEVPIPSLSALFLSSLPIFATLESSNIAEVVKGLQSQGKINPRVNPFLPLVTGVKKTFEMPMAYISYDHIFNVARRYQNISDAEYCSKIHSFPVLKAQIRLVTAMTMPKYSPLRETFNHKITFLKERGLLHRHQQNFHLSGGVQCTRGHQDSKTPLALDDLFTALSVIALGCIASIGVLLLERLFVKWKRRKTDSTKILKRNIQF